MGFLYEQRETYLSQFIYSKDFNVQCVQCAVTVQEITEILLLLPNNFTSSIRI